MQRDAFRQSEPRKISLDRIFANYQKASLELIRMSSVQQSERDAIAAEYERQLQKKDKFDEDYLRWVSSAEDRENSELDSDSRTSSAHRSKSKTVTKENVSLTSQASRVSVARQRLKQIEEEQHLIRRRRTLLREIENLEMKKQLLEARGDIERAILESNLDEDENHGSEVAKLLSRLDEKHQSSREKVESYLEDLELNDPEPSARNAAPADQLHQILECQRNTLQMMALGVDLPKREFLQFDGDPAKYPRFMKNFEVNVEKRIRDNNTRLSYLIQFCS